MTPASSPLPEGLSASFDIVRPLGAGGMGAVWLVRDRFLDRLVALKVLHAEQSGVEQRERFLREARTSARLEHPHIIDVYRADETDGVVWFSMRYINGESVGDRLRDRGPMPVPEALRVLREVAWGLAYAHARGVVHRDIKPDNILLDRDSGRAVVTDFGISLDAADASKLTMMGNVLGSVHYMSPEQAAGEAVDGRADLYALGCVAFHMLAGQPPFDGSAQSVLVAHVTRPAPELSTVAPQLPASTSAVIARCLAKAPAQRYANADALAAALDAALRDAELQEQAAADAAPGGVLSEDDARAVWQRAAQLQAEAAHRMERTATLRPAQTSGGQRTIAESEYRVRDVEAAAMEAGISRQYVALALAEIKLRASAGGTVVVTSEAVDRRLTLFLGTSDRALSVSRTIAGSPKDVLAALGQVFTTPPRGLDLVDTVNGHPLDGGVMHFRMPRFTQTYTNPFAAFDKTNGLKLRLEQIELFDLHVTLQPRGSAAAPSCEVVITGDLRPGLRRNLAMDYGMTAGSGLLSAFLAAKVAAKLAAVSAVSPVALAVGAAGAVLGVAACFIWYRWLFRSALEKANDELGGLLKAVEQQLTAQRLFSGERQTGSLPSATSP